MDVLLTGAHGTVGTAITTHSEHEFTLLDRGEPPETLDDGTPHPHLDRETVAVDATDLDSVVDAADGHDAIVHLAAYPSTDATYEQAERINVRATHRVLEAAKRTDVETVVFASSNHAVGMYEKEHAPELYQPDYDLTVDHESELRPDSHYGSSKAAGEAWGRQYQELHDVDFHALRIGSIRDPTDDHPYGDAERGVERGDWDRGSDAYEEQVARMKCLWQSRRDIGHMVDCCLRSDVEFGIFYGTSDNANGWLDLSHARETIDYNPADSGEEWTEPPETGSFDRT